MLDDISYPSSFIEYGNLKIEFSDASIIENKIICEAKISILKKDN